MERHLKGVALGEQNSNSHHLSGSRFAYMLGARSDAYLMYVSDESLDLVKRGRDPGPARAGPSDNKADRQNCPAPRGKLKNG